MADTYNLQRFLDAQEEDYSRALQEIRNGKKQGHWMWYIFPQLKGLGNSPTSQFYGIDGMKEAEAYLHHPVLGERLREISRALLKYKAKKPREIMSTPDDLKLRSSMTLFAKVTDSDPVFEEILDTFFEGEKDGKTLKKLDAEG